MLAQFQSDDRDFQLMQNSWSTSLNPVIKNSNAIGTYLTAQNSTGITLVTATTQNLTSLSIPAGLWLVWGFVAFPSLPANTTQTVGMISTSSSTQSGQTYDGTTAIATETPANGSISFTIGPQFLKLLTATPYYLNAQASFSGTAPTSKGTLFAVQLGVV